LQQTLHSTGTIITKLSENNRTLNTGFILTWNKFITF